MRVKHIKEGMVIKADLRYPVGRPEGMWIRRVALVKTVRHLKSGRWNTRSIVLTFLSDEPIGWVDTLRTYRSATYIGRNHHNLGKPPTPYPRDDNNVGTGAFFSNELRIIRQIPKAEAIVWRIENNI